MADAGAGENGQDDRAKRRDALSAIARTAPASATQAESDDLRVTTLDGSIYRKRHMRPAWRWGLALALMALLVAGVYGYQRYTAARVAPLPPIARTLNIDLTLSALYCPRNIAWSPDSLSLAVIADAQNCGADGGYRPSTRDLALGIFNARTGALEKRFVIASASVVGKIITPVFGVAWSHDGSTVYVTISGEDLAGASLPASLLVAPLRGGHVQLYTIRPGGSSQAGIIWNLNDLPSATTLSKPLAPAQSYTFLASGILPGEPFPTDVTTYTGAKSPSGGFAFWQAGTISASWAPANSGANGLGAPMALYYDSYVSQPSPDGAALVGGLWLQARIPAPSPPAPAFNPAYCIAPDNVSQTSPYCSSTVIPYPDKALAAVAGVVEQGVRFNNGGATQWYPASVAWRSDGKLLAVLLPADGFETDGSAARVTVYSASTGAIVAHFTAARAVTGTNLELGGVSPVQWSPSGQQIALMDWASSEVTVWDARGLAA